MIKGNLIVTVNELPKFVVLMTSEFLKFRNIYET